MDMLIISGAPDTGKTITIREIYERLLVMGYTDTSHENMPEKKDDDFTRTLLNLDNKAILIHSATDDEFNINILFDNINNNYDLVITSCRDLYHPREYFFRKQKEYQDHHKISISIEEFPLAKITRRSHWKDAHNWYFNACINQLMNKLTSAPYNL